MSAGQFYLSSWKFVSPEPIQTTFTWHGTPDVRVRGAEVVVKAQFLLYTGSHWSIWPARPTGKSRRYCKPTLWEGGEGEREREGEGGGEGGREQEGEGGRKESPGDFFNLTPTCSQNVY